MAAIRHQVAAWLCNLGAWMIRRGILLDPDGGGGIVAVTHGNAAWTRLWHRGYVEHAVLASVLARESAIKLQEHGAMLDEIDGMTGQSAES